MTDRDPAGASVFALELDGVEVAWFLGCDGPRSRTAVVEIEEGGVNDRVHQLPGKTTWAPIVLRAATAVSPAESPHQRPRTPRWRPNAR